MKEMFPPEKCPKCGADTVVMHYNNGYRVECPNNPECIMKITEEQFQQQVKELAQLYGYMYYHTWKSYHSVSGFPDCVLVRLEPTPRLIFVELKTDDLKNSQPSITQWCWLRVLQHLPGPVECYLFRPGDWEEIEERLK